MKKVLLVAVAGMFVLASCKKDYTCECTTTLDGKSTTTPVEMKDTKKKDAEKACDALALSGAKCALK